MGSKVWKVHAQSLAVLISTTEGTRIEQDFLKECFIHVVQRGLSDCLVDVVWLLFVASLKTGPVFLEKTHIYIKVA